MTTRENESVAQQNEYLELLKKCITASLYDESAWRIVHGLRRPTLQNRLHPIVATLGDYCASLLRRVGVLVVWPKPYDAAVRTVGADWPMFGYSMVGLHRLTNLQSCIEDVIANEVAGDLIETGVWRGGSVIFMRAVLKTLGVKDRIVWAADSFEGLPKPSKHRPDLVDEWDLSQLDVLSVSLQQVQANFERFSLLDEQVRFLKGWFKDTLKVAPIASLAILRLDGDLFESTMDAIVPLYPKVSPGGYVIVDDYYAWPGCKKAIDEYRSCNGITAEMKRVDWTCAYWQVPH